MKRRSFLGKITQALASCCVLPLAAFTKKTKVAALDPPFSVNGETFYLEEDLRFKMLLDIKSFKLFGHEAGSVGLLAGLRPKEFTYDTWPDEWAWAKGVVNMNNFRSNVRTFIAAYENGNVRLIVHGYNTKNVKVCS